MTCVFNRIEGDLLALSVNIFLFDFQVHTHYFPFFTLMVIVNNGNRGLSVHRKEYAESRRAFISLHGPKLF